MRCAVSRASKVVRCHVQKLQDVRSEVQVVRSSMRRKGKEKKGLTVSRPNRGYKRQARRSPGGHRASTKAGQEQKEEKLKEKQGEEG